MTTEEVALGIDLGTTYCCVAIHRKGVTQVLPNDVGNLTTPSYIAIDKGEEETEEILVGHMAKSLSYQNPERTIFNVKKLLGRKIFDTFVQPDKNSWPFQLVNEKFQLKIKIENQTYSLEEVTSHLLKFLKVTAEDFLGHQVSKAVIAIPPYFYDHQIEAVREAAGMAGLQVLKVVQEPIAAAGAYHHQRENQNRKKGPPAPAPTGEKAGPKNVLIFDLGGATLDVAVVSMNGPSFEILAVDGHYRIGGDNFDDTMVAHCLQQFKNVEKIDLWEKRASKNSEESQRALKAIRRLKAECERQKVLLSAAKSVTVSLDSLYQGKKLSVKFDQTLFNQLNAQMFDNCIEIVERVIENSGVTASGRNGIDEIVLVGGSSRIPRIQQMLSEFFGGKSLTKHIDPDTAVAVGAAIEAEVALKRFQDGCLLETVEDSGGEQMEDATLFQSLRNLAVFNSTAYENAPTIEADDLFQFQNHDDDGEKLKKIDEEVKQSAGGGGGLEGKPPKKPPRKAVNFQDV